MATRRDLFRTMAAGAVAAPLAALSGGNATAAAVESCVTAPPRWRRGVEGQRRADLGDGTYLNPIVAGDRPDPTILKDGVD